MKYVKSCLMITITAMCSLSFASVYDVGDIVSEADQHITKPTCYAGNEYENGDSWKLADWNGATNGGNYNVIFIDMHATWCAPCVTYMFSPGAMLYQEYADNPHVKFITALTDPGQPYSCEQWGNLPDSGSSQLIHDTNQTIVDLYNTDEYYPSMIWIDHEMRVYDKSNIEGSWGISARIDQMLEECGSLCDDSDDGGCTTPAGDLNEDTILNIQDIIIMLNHILETSLLTNCPLEAADMNMDEIINVQDVVILIDNILNP